MSKPLSQKPLSPKPIEIGAYEAKTHLPRILREVAAGQSFTITVRGKPVAELKPTPTRQPMTHKEAVRAMMAYMDRPDRPFISANELKSILDEGRNS
jgi:prevent-host-death family protein